MRTSNLYWWRQHQKFDSNRAKWGKCVRALAESWKSKCDGDFDFWPFIIILHEISWRPVFELLKFEIEANLIKWRLYFYSFVSWSWFVNTENVVSSFLTNNSVFLWLHWTLEDSHPSREDRWQGQRWIEWGICSWRWSSFNWKFFNRSFVSKSQGCQQPKIVPFSMCFLSSVWNDVFMRLDK